MTHASAGMAVLRRELVDFSDLGVEHRDSLAQPLLDQRGGKLGREAREQQEFAAELVLAELLEQRAR